MKRLTAARVLHLIAERGITVYASHPAYVEAGAEVPGSFGRVIKKRAYWHEYKSGELAIAAVVQQVVSAQALLMYPQVAVQMIRKAISAMDSAA